MSISIKRFNGLCSLPQPLKLFMVVPHLLSSYVSIGPAHPLLTEEPEVALFIGCHGLRAPFQLTAFECKIESRCMGINTLDPQT